VVLVVVMVVWFCRMILVVVFFVIVLSSVPVFFSAKYSRNHFKGNSRLRIFLPFNRSPNPFSEGIAFYCLTTPIGIVIGIGANTAFNTSSEQFILPSGVWDAVSAGILLYDGLVNIVHPHFTSDAFKKATIVSQVAQYTALWLGATGMAIVGHWA
jgi:hypothetical protein